jgi:hypothetical protein
MDRTIPDRYVAQIAAIRELNRQAYAATVAGDHVELERLMAKAQVESHMLVTEMAGYLATVPA